MEFSIKDVVEMVRALNETKPVERPHPFVGMFVIARCSAAGVHAGTLESAKGNTAILRDARRLWSWKTKGGIALSGLSVHGLADGKIDTKVEIIYLTGIAELIPCTRAAKESIHDHS